MTSCPCNEARFLCTLPYLLAGSSTAAIEQAPHTWDCCHMYNTPGKYLSRPQTTPPPGEKGLGHFKLLNFLVFNNSGWSCDGHVNLNNLLICMYNTSL